MPISNVPPAAAPSSANSPPGFSMRSVTNDEYKEVLTDIVAGKSLTGRKKAMKEAIFAQAKKHLNDNNSKEFAPGQFTTGFSNVFTLKNAAAVKPAGWVVHHDDDKLIVQILGRTVEHLKQAEGPGRIPKTEVLLLNNVIKDEPPCTTGWNPSHPLRGQDGHHNHVFILLAEHEAMTSMADLLQSSRSTPHDLAKDDWSWARTAWLSALSQLTVDQLREQLQKLHCPAADQAMIESMANQFREKGLDAILLQKEDGTPLDGGGRLGTGKEDCEPALKRLTEKMFADIEDYSGNRISCEDGSILPSHIMTVLTCLGAKGAIWGNENVLSDDKRGRNLLTSSPRESEAMATLGIDDWKGHARHALLECVGIPVIVQTGDRFEIRFSDPTLARQAEESIRTSFGSPPEDRATAGNAQAEQAQGALLAQQAVQTQPLQQMLMNQQARQALAAHQAQLRRLQQPRHLEWTNDSDGAERAMQQQQAMEMAQIEQLQQSQQIEQMEQMQQAVLADQLAERLAAEQATLTAQQAERANEAT